MADRAVDLPKPHPDDHEDVVDWLSTARALWARGERADALVWLRRAAEAAAMAGQPFRASEIGMYVTALEETFGDLPARAAPPPRVAESDRPPQDTLVDSNEAFGALASEVLRSKLTSIEVDIEEDTLIEDEPAGLAAPPPDVAPAPKAPPPPPPIASRPPPAAAHEPKIIVQVASVPPSTPAPVTAPMSAPPAQAPSGPSASGSAPPPPAPARPASAPPPPSFIPPLAAPRTPEGEEITLVSAGLQALGLRPPAGVTVPFGASPLAATPLPPPARVPQSVAPPPPSLGAPPLAVPPPPLTPTGDGFGLRARRDGAASPKRAKPSSAPPPPSSSSARPAPPSSPPPGSAPPPPRSPMPSSTGIGAPPAPRRVSRRPPQRVQREPILDPWAEDQIAAPRRPVPPAPKSGTEEVVVVRARMPSLHEEDEVFTSAAPLPVALRRNPPAPPPPAPSAGAQAPAAPAPPPPAPSAGAQAPAAPPASAQPVTAPPVPPPPPVPSPAPAPARPGRLPASVEVSSKSIPPPEPVPSNTAPSAPPPAAKPAAVPAPAKATPVSPAAKATAASPAAKPSSVPPPAATSAAAAQATAASPAAKPSSVPPPAATSAAASPAAKSAPPAPAAKSATPTPAARSATAPPPAKSAPSVPPQPAKSSAASPAAKPAMAPPGATSPASVPPPAAKSPASVPPPAVKPAAAATKAAPAAASPAKLASVAPPPSAASAQPARVAARTASKVPPPPAASAPRPATVPPPPAAAPPAAEPPAAEPPAAAPPAAAPPAAEPPAAAFDPARATLPMVLEIEPPERPVGMPSMRPTLPMPIELPREIEAMFAAAASEDDPVLLRGTRLDQVDAFEGLPRSAHELLAAQAQIVELGPDEEIGGFGGALLLSGTAVLCATIVDAAAHWARPRELLVARGTLADGVAVRVVGSGEGAAVAVWPRPSLEQALSAHAPCEARARARGDRLQALAGATMGPFGEIDDDHRRALAAELSVRCLAPGEVWLEDGAPAPAIALVGAGEVELYGPISEETSETVEPGALVFPDLAGTGGEASSSARAGASGALLLLADRDVAQHMVERVPDLAARLRGA